jgi:quercetin dioxygenase-like cupin family protein
VKIIRLAEAERYEPQPGWTRSSLCDEEPLSAEHFIKPPGHASPLHAHPQAQLLVVLDGQLVVEAAGSEVVLEAGDSAFFEGGEEHRVRNDGQTAASGLDIFSPGRDFGFWRQRVADDAPQEG